MTPRLDDDDLAGIAERAQLLSTANGDPVARWEVEALVAEIRSLRGVERWPGDSGQHSQRGPWIQTYTGRRFYPLSPQTADIVVDDIAHALSMVCRWAGHASRFYSVAEHSVIVSLYVPAEYAREALLHDASEAYIGDMSRPLKHAPEMAEYRRAEAELQCAILERFGVKSTPESLAAIKTVDDEVPHDEIRALMRDPSMFAARTGLGAHITGLTPGHARHVFAQRFVELFPGVA